ncbi:hypothetical protein EB796_017953 [Bugula neritina]|uniref:Uncharacterized protein n=1 Tax=Bugula neritina TaxID=10212 RepID=A0A7J7JDP9_BUGNE|nr:hypothetical protein EB796_017953 [Bugula neritina]
MEECQGEREAAYVPPESSSGRPRSYTVDKGTAEYSSGLGGARYDVGNTRSDLRSACHKTCTNTPGLHETLVFLKNL